MDSDDEVPILSKPSIKEGSSDPLSSFSLLLLRNDLFQARFDFVLANFGIEGISSFGLEVFLSKKVLEGSFFLLTVCGDSKCI